MRWRGWKNTPIHRVVAATLVTTIVLGNWLVPIGLDKVVDYLINRQTKQSTNSISND